MRIEACNEGMEIRCEDEGGKYMIRYQFVLDEANSLGLALELEFTCWAS